MERHPAAPRRRLARPPHRNACPTCGARLFTSDLDNFPGQVFVQLGSLDDPSAITPKLEMFVKRRLPWAKPLGLPEFSDMPTRPEPSLSGRKCSGHRGHPANLRPRRKLRPRAAPPRKAAAFGMGRAM